MSVPVTVYDHIRQNNVKTALLIALFPVSLCALFFGLSFAFYFWAYWDGATTAGNALQQAFSPTLTAFVVFAPALFIAALIWMIAAAFFGGSIMLSLAQAEPLSPEDARHRQVLRAVQNVALAAGLPTPKAYVIADDSLNAFAAGYSPKTASITLTSGMIKKLSPLELEGVIAHEMAHIGNRDVRLNMVVLIGLSISGLLADMIGRAWLFSPRGRGGDREKNGITAIIFIAWLSLTIFNLLIAPLIFFAISRTREYAADATGALITRNPHALANALQKISADPRVEVLDAAPHMAAACIYTPRADVKPFLGIGDTHPAVSDRIRRLKAMG